MHLSESNALPIVSTPYVNCLISHYEPLVLLFSGADIKFDFPARVILVGNGM
jgi:hypothetical protein